VELKIYLEELGVVAPPGLGRWVQWDGNAGRHHEHRIDVLSTLSHDR
jgi:hypothetical protein